MTQFQATENGLRSLTTKKIFRSDEVAIARFYRFEGESDPDDNAILYAIETGDGEKGTIADVYGPKNDQLVTDCMKLIRFHSSDVAE